MKFFNSSGSQTSRRQASSQTSTGDLSEVQKLIDVVKSILTRLSVLESNSTPEATEFEFDVVNGTKISLPHYYNSNVRYWVTWWTPTVNDAPNFSAFINSATGTNSNVLVLTPKCTGHAVIRVEKSQHGVSH